jgi:hypothetical protein
MGLPCARSSSPETATALDSGVDKPKSPKAFAGGDVGQVGYGFGLVWFTNHGTVFKPGTPWFFTAYLQIETLLLEEAQRLWALEHTE